MKIAQRNQLPKRLVALAADRQIGDREQVVGGLAHGRNNHDGPPVEAGFHDAGNAFDGRGGFDGRAAEFHDDH